MAGDDGRESEDGGVLGTVEMLGTVETIGVLVGLVETVCWRAWCGGTKRGSLFELGRAPGWRGRGRFEVRGERALLSGDAAGNS